MPPAARDHLGALRRGDPAARAWRARTSTSAQDFLDLTFALESGEKLDHLLRYEAPVRVYLPRPSSPPTGPTSPSSSTACAPRPASTSPRPTTPRRRRSGSRWCRRSRSPDLPHRRLLHRARRDRLAGLPAPPRPSARLRWSDQGTLGPRGDLPAARHHAAGRARLPGRGDHPGARSRERPLPPAGFDLERRQLPRHGDAFRHADPARALPAGAAQRHEPRRGGGGCCPACSTG